MEQTAILALRNWVYPAGARLQAAILRYERVGGEPNKYFDRPTEDDTKMRSA